jgi:hypothetical protein
MIRDYYDMRPKVACAQCAHLVRESKVGVRGLEDLVVVIANPIDAEEEDEDEHIEAGRMTSPAPSNSLVNSGGYSIDEASMLRTQIPAFHHLEEGLTVPDKILEVCSTQQPAPATPALSLRRPVARKSRLRTRARKSSDGTDSKGGARQTEGNTGSFSPECAGGGAESGQGSDI